MLNSLKDKQSEFLRLQLEVANMRVDKINNV